MPKGYYRKRSEATEQERVINWATFYAKDFPELALLHHIPTGSRQPQTAGRESWGAGLMLASTQKRKTRAVCGNEVAEEQDHGQAGLVA